MNALRLGGIDRSGGDDFVRAFSVCQFFDRFDRIFFGTVDGNVHAEFFGHFQSAVIQVKHDHLLCSAEFGKLRHKASDRTGPDDNKRVRVAHFYIFQTGEYAGKGLA